MRLAHLSDPHLLSENARSRSLAARFVSLHRPFDREGRNAKLARALEAAHARGADHLVLSGDLTEVGALAEFEVLAELLDASAFAPHQVTLVPGNHDAYTGKGGWTRALEGPLAPYRATSAEAAPTVKPIDLGELVLLPVDTTAYQSVASSYGVFRSETAEALRAHLHGVSSADAPRVVVQHHPPFPRQSRTWQRIDGLQGWSALSDLLLEYPTLSLLHGHLHKIITRVMGGVHHARVFGAAATVDDTAEPRVRIYEVAGGTLLSVGAASFGH